jgi:hypothetical protein
MRVVIVGLGKSGTTAALYAVRSAMPAETRMLFEPHAYVVLQSPHVAAKVLLHPAVAMDYVFYRQFDKIVLMARDPRDILISKALYRVFGGKTMHTDTAKLDQYLALLRAKEANPRAVSLTRINALFQTLTNRPLHSDEGTARLLNDAIAFHDAFPDCLLFKYEAMVEGQFESVAQYLSLRAEAMIPDVPDQFRRVARSLRAGNWRDWFCPEDVAHYRPLLSAYMNRYGYADDWTLASEPRIRPEECSEYVMRLVRERRGGSAAAVG